MAQEQLKKASITVLAGAAKGKVIGVLFNPAEYSFERTNAYKAIPIPGLGMPLFDDFRRPHRVRTERTH